MQLDALRLGAPVYLTTAEAKAVNEVNEGTPLTANARQWLLWEAQANAHATNGVAGGR